MAIGRPLPAHTALARVRGELAAHQLLLQQEILCPGAAPGAAGGLVYLNQAGHAHRHDLLHAGLLALPRQAVHHEAVDVVAEALTLPRAAHIPPVTAPEERHGDGSTLGDNYCIHAPTVGTYT